MHILVGIALKSLLLAGLTLGLMRLMRERSAAERSWVAHIGLLALVVMALAPLVLPTWNVETPAVFRTAPDAQQVSPVQTVTAAPVAAASPAAQPVAAQPKFTLPSLGLSAAATAIYALPAVILLLITFLALARLITLRARADVLVDGHWLSALARAQKRMGFKHGTALLTSDELASPISWGLMRPVILLNSRAVEAADEAEAIIAHELAHVARLDWIKLLLARIATALFWFNPLVWVLAREAHQLREETADDTVLAADIVDTDYAQLLVGVARHECPGLLLGAHGVAPSKGSLARRVQRVLDGKLMRGPVARPFGIGVFVGAIMVAAPLAALTLTPSGTKSTAGKQGAMSASETRASSTTVTSEPPADLPRLIAKGVSTSVSTAVAAATAIAPSVASDVMTGDFKAISPNGATVEQKNGTIIARNPNGATVEQKNGMIIARGANGATSTIYPPDANGRRKVVAVAPNGAVAITYADARDFRGPRVPRRDGTIDKVIEMKAVGVTPEYIGAMRAALPQLGSLDLEDLTSMRAVGVTPDYARGLAGAGFPNVTADQLVEARAVGLTGGYIQAMRSIGLRGDLDDFVELRAVGVDPAFAARVKASGTKVSDADDLVEMHALGLTAPPAPPRPPAQPRNWHPSDPGG